MKDLESMLRRGDKLHAEETTGTHLDNFLAELWNDWPALSAAIG